MVIDKNLVFCEGQDIDGISGSATPVAGTDIITVGKADAECPEKVTLASGMVNAVQIVFSFSGH